MQGEINRQSRLQLELIKQRQMGEEEEKGKKDTERKLRK
jgi:hypothetical protein